MSLCSWHAVRVCHTSHVAAPERAGAPEHHLARRTRKALGAVVSQVLIGHVRRVEIVRRAVGVEHVASRDLGDAQIASALLPLPGDAELGGGRDEL